MRMRVCEIGGPCSLGIYGRRASGMPRIGCERWRQVPPTYMGHRTLRPVPPPRRSSWIYVVRWAGLAAREFLDREPPGCQGLDAKGGGNCLPDVGHRTFRMGTLSLAVRSSTEPASSNHGPITDTELEEPAPSDTDTELDEPAPAFHAPDAEVAETDRRRRRNSNGGPVGPLTRSRAKKIKRLSDHLSPAMSHRLAMRGLHDHNDPA